MGLDVSTQSLSASVLDIDERKKLAELSLDYLKDERLNTFGIRESDYILPPRSFGKPLHITGGAAGGHGIMRRVAAIWNRPLIVMGKGGAALGAAVAGVSAYFKHTGEMLNVEDYSMSVSPRGEIIEPIAEDVKVFHNPGGYLEKFAREEASFIKKYPLG